MISVNESLLRQPNKSLKTYLYLNSNIRRFECYIVVTICRLWVSALHFDRLLHSTNQRNKLNEFVVNKMTILLCKIITTNF